MTVLFHTGRVVDRLFLPGASPTTITVPLFVGGSIAVVGVPWQNRVATPGFYIYDVEDERRKRVRVADRGEIARGACVNVFIRAGAQVTDAAIPPGDGVLRAASGC